MIDKQEKTTLLLKGGAAKGIAYVGALKTLCKSKKLASITTLAGSSAGTITAFLYALAKKRSASSNDADAFERELDKALSNMTDRKKLSTMVGLSPLACWRALCPAPLLRLVMSRNGLAGDRLRIFLETCCSGEEKNLTWQELADESGLNLCAVLTTRHGLELAWAQSGCRGPVNLGGRAPSSTHDYARESAIDIVCASAALPFVFSGIEFNNSAGDGSQTTYALDGGIVANLPVEAVTQQLGVREADILALHLSPPETGSRDRGPRLDPMLTKLCRLGAYVLATMTTTLVLPAVLAWILDQIGPADAWYVSGPAERPVRALQMMLVLLFTALVGALALAVRAWSTSMGAVAQTVGRVWEGLWGQGERFAVKRLNDARGLVKINVGDVGTHVVWPSETLSKELEKCGREAAERWIKGVDMDPTKREEEVRWAGPGLVYVLFFDLGGIGLLLGGVSLVYLVCCAAVLGPWDPTAHLGSPELSEIKDACASQDFTLSEKCLATISRGRTAIDGSNNKKSPWQCGKGGSLSRALQETVCASAPRTRYTPAEGCEICEQKDEKCTKVEMPLSGTMAYSCAVALSQTRVGWTDPKEWHVFRLGQPTQ